MLVLEENQVLREHQDLLQKKILDIQKIHIKEIGNLSKRVIISDSDKADLQNQVETLKLNLDDLTGRYNDVHAESQRRVTLQEHMRQTGELKRRLDEAEARHKQELDMLAESLKNLHSEKKDIALKLQRASGINKKLYAENKVLDKALKYDILVQCYWLSK